MWGPGIIRKRRHVVVAEMIESAVRRGDFESPWSHHTAVWEFFHDESDILRELQQDWRTALAGAVYIAIDKGDGDLHHDVMQAFTLMERRHHGLRRILEAHADHPAIEAAMRKERALLSSFVSVMADDAADDPQAA